MTHTTTLGTVLERAPKVPLSIRVPIASYLKLRAEADRRNTTITAVVREALEPRYAPDALDTGDAA